nr:hypothetical protein [Tanacetum cinerariifolium]
EIEFCLYQGEDSDLKDLIDQSDLANLDDLFVDPTPDMFTDEQPPDYSFPPRFDVYPDDFLETESDADNFYDDLFDSKGGKIKETELLIINLISLMIFFQSYHVFKVNLIFIRLMKIFHVQSGNNTPPLDVLLFHFYPP